MLLVNDLPPGGASGTEVHVELLRDGLRAGGDEVEVFHGPGRLGRVGDLWDPFARRTLRAVVAGFRPDVVHAHNVVRELSTAVLTGLAPLPLVLTAHDGRLLGDADGQGRLLRAYQRRRAPLDAAVVRRSADLVLAVSPSLAARLSAAGFAKVRQARAWAADPVAPLRPPQDCSALVFLGRLDADKGVHVLCEAALRLPPGRLLLAGPGRLDHPAVDSGHVRLLGTLDRPGVSRLLAEARAVVAPSLPSLRPEGAPLVLLEALVHGRPIVVSDDVGAAGLTAGGSAGLVVPAGDPTALAAALQLLLDDAALVARLAAGARAQAPAYGPAAGLARVRSAYAAVGAG